MMRRMGVANQTEKKVMREKVIPQMRANGKAKRADNRR